MAVVRQFAAITVYEDCSFADTLEVMDAKKVAFHGFLAQDVYPMLDSVAIGDQQGAHTKQLDGVVPLLHFKPAFPPRLTRDT